MKKRNLFTALIFIIVILSLANADKVWRNVYFDETGYSNRIEDIRGDSNIIWAAESKNSALKLLSSTDFGKTWSIIHEDYTSYPPVEHPYPRRFENMEYPAPGYMYFQYNEGAIKRYDERTGKMLDTTFFPRHEVFNKAKFSKFMMLDSVTGVMSSVGQAFITTDGWKTYRSIDTLTDDFGSIVHPHMLSPDSLIVYVYYNSCDGWYHCIVEEDTVRYELLGESMLGADISTIPANMAVINRKTWVVATLGTSTGNGNSKYQEIYKTTDGGVSWRQVHKSAVAPAHGLQDIEFLDSLHGIATGNAITLFTDDGGETWEIHNLFRTNDWQNWVGGKETYNPMVIFIDYIESEPFIGCFSSGIFRFEEEPSSIYEREQVSHLVYPNLLSPGDCVSFDIDFQGPAEVFLYSVSGEELDNAVIKDNTYHLDSGLPVGTYFIVVKTENGYPIRERIILK